MRVRSTTRASRLLVPRARTEDAFVRMAGATMAVSTAKGLPAKDGGYCKARPSWFACCKLGRHGLGASRMAPEQIRPYQKSRQVFLVERKARAVVICRACYRSLTEVTFMESPSTSPVTSTRRWSFLSEAFSAATICLFPSASNFKNFLSLVIMPKPLASHLRAQARGWLSGLSATFLEQFESTTETSLKDSVAPNAGSANRPNRAR